MGEASERLEDLTVLDLDGQAKRLGALWGEGDRPVVLVFLRHYG